MPRGNGKNRGRGGFRGANPENFRGRGRGFSRGRGNGRGRGRGGPAYLDDFDFPIQQWSGNEPPPFDNFRGGRGFRPRGRGRGAHSMSGSGASTPRYAFPTYGKGRGLGRGEPVAADNLQRTYGFGRNLASKLQAGAPLSKVLYEDRPLLKPIIFVRSVYNPTLFKEEEDIFKPVVEPAVDGDEKSHVPTADAVSRVFNPNADVFDDSEADEEELEEIDFADIGRLQAEVDAAAAVTDTTATQPITVHEQTTFFVDTTPAPIMLNKHPQRIAVNKLEGALGQAADDDEVIVYVAPHPRPTRARTPQQDAPATVDTIPSTSILTGLAGGSNASTIQASPPTEERSTVVLELGTLYPEEASSVQEQMSVSLGPDPSELPPPPSFDNMSFAFEKTAARKQTRRLHPVGTPRSLLKRSRKARRKSLRGFGAYGAMHEEAQLHDVDPRRDEQRRGDSDVNWGDSDEDDKVEELSTGVADMEIDENVSLAAMKRFVHSMSAEGSQHVTMDDIVDIARLKVEDEEEKTRGAESAEEEDDSERAEEHLAIPEDVGLESESESETEDEEVEAIFRAEEAELVGESDHNGAQIRGVGDARDEEDDEDEDDESAEESSDDEETPKRGFQARLERLRASTGKGKDRAAISFSDDESSDDAMSVQMTWADEDEDFFDSIETILEENQDILLSRDRKSKKKLFTAIRDGTFERDMFTDMMAPAKRGKTRDVPEELREQWEKDRAKKAENKRKRAEDRMKVAADPLAHHKGGKKGRKAMLAAARAAADADLPNRITDFVSLEQQIRRFLADIGGPQIMSLPPADKETRKRVHELATAFNLKSQSKGSGNSRYTTLTKTSRSGIGINERKVRRILKQATNGAWEGPETGKSGRSKAMSLAKHREGEEVGKEAPKIGETNVGFKMLAAMGWTDGNRIGLSGGLETPLVAIMKKTKRGLGAAL